MQEVYSLIKNVLDKVQGRANSNYSDLLGLLEDMEDRLSAIRGKVTAGINSPAVEDIVEKEQISSMEENLKEEYTRIVTKEIIKKKTVTNEVTYEVQKPLSSYDHVALLREAISNIKQYDSQPQIIREAFNYCTSLADRVFLFLERRNEGCFAGYEGYIRNKPAEETRLMIAKKKVSLQDDNILTRVYKEKSPYIGEITQEDIPFFESLDYEKDDTVSVFPVLLKGTVVAVFVFDKNVWEYAHLLDVLLIASELKMELTFAKRKTEPHYPPLDITGYMDSSERLEKRTILKQDRSEREEPDEVSEVEASGSGDSVLEAEIAEIEEEEETDYSISQETSDPDEPVLEAEEDSPEDEGFLEEEEELERETEQIYISDADESMEEEELENSDMEMDEEIAREEETDDFFGEPGKQKSREITDELTITKEDEEFDEEVLEEDNFDYGERRQAEETVEEETEEGDFGEEAGEEMEIEDEDESVPAPESEEAAEEETREEETPYRGDRTQQVDSADFNEEDMGFDEEDIEGEIEGELGPIPEEIKEQPEIIEPEEEAPELSEEEQTLFDEARRFARLVVSEIKLYYEEDVKKGRLNKNLYQLLKVHIDRGRALYDGRVSERVKQSRDFYQEALVDILGAGDESALGM